MLDEEEPNDDRVGDGEMPRKRMKTENSVPDGEVRAFDAPINGSQQTIKREPGSDAQTGSDVGMATSAHESRKPPQASAISMVTLSSDDESDQEDGLSPHSSAASSSNLKVVYDVEYQPPY